MTTTAKEGMVHPSRRTMPGWRGALLVAVVTVTIVAAPASPVPAGADPGPGAPGLAYTATGCTQAVAFIPLPRPTLEARVYLPERFRVRELAPKVGLLGVNALSCGSISVGGQPARPGQFGSVAVMIESPDGTAGDHFYQLWAVSDHQDLVSLMTKVGAATDTAGIWFEKTPASATATIISKLSNYKVSVFTSPPESGDRDGANTWWHEGTHGTVRIANHGHDVAGNYGGYVLETAAGSPLAQMLGTTILTGAGGVVHIGEARGALSLHQWQEPRQAP